MWNWTVKNGEEKDVFRRLLMGEGGDGKPELAFGGRWTITDSSFSCSAEVCSGCPWIM